MNAKPFQRPVALPPAAMGHESGYCWYVDLPSGVTGGDDLSNLYRSRWRLLEDERSLRFPHSYHNDIRFMGRGRYSHWGSRLFFSSSDNTSPATNGRSYVLAPPLPGDDEGWTPDEALADGDEPFRTLFLVGCGHSGTTLLFNLLKSHPDVVATNGYPDGEDHDGWIRHGSMPLAGLGLQGTERITVGHQRCLAMGPGDATRDRVARLRTYYSRGILGPDQDRLAVNKCPHISNKLGYVGAVFRKARFVHVVRDVGPVVRGWLKVVDGSWEGRLYWPAEADPCLWTLAPGEEPLFDADPERFMTPERWQWFVHYWVETNRCVADFAERNPDRVMVVRYEDLCLDRAGSLARLTAFAGLAPFEPVPDYPPVRLPGFPDEHWTESCAAAHPGVRAMRTRFGYA